jgi:hypothetical protein
MPASPQRPAPVVQVTPAAQRAAKPAAPSPRSSAARAAGSAGKPPSKPPIKREIVKTWAFDSVGPRKYAMQIQRASNGNPLLLIVEGKPQEDGTFRRISVYVWSEDFEKLFATLDEVRAYMREHDIKTPAGHKYDPNAKAKWSGKRSGGAIASAPRRPGARAG